MYCVELMTFSISELIFSYVPDRQDFKNTIKLDQRGQPDQHSLRNKTRPACTTRPAQPEK